MALPVRSREQTASRPAAAWEPFREFEELQRRTAELMESVWSGIGGGEDQPWIPLVDVEETDDAWIVEAEVPGARRDDVNVELRDSELVISGEIKERERTGILRRRTRRTGRFEYRVVLPGQPEPDAVEATLDDGVLTVRVPKPEQARPRRVEVQPANTT
jgi:HSP20 family protein